MTALTSSQYLPFYRQSSILYFYAAPADLTDLRHLVFPIRKFLLILFGWTSFLGAVCLIITSIGTLFRHPRLTTFPADILDYFGSLYFAHFVIIKNTLFVLSGLCLRVFVMVFKPSTDSYSSTLS